MKNSFTLLISLLLASTSLAEMHIFTDTKGRTISAKIVTVLGDTIVIERKDGKTFTLPIVTFSEDDQMYVKEWVKNNEAIIAEQKRAEEVKQKRTSIAAYCVAKQGQQVGNGECWTLADEAYNSCKAKRPEDQLRVWGRLVDIESEKIEPGDVIEFDRASIPGYGNVPAAHTAIAIKGGRSKRCTVAEQNVGNDKTVRFTELDLRKINSGEVKVYRLEK